MKEHEAMRVRLALGVPELVEKAALLARLRTAIEAQHLDIEHEDWHDGWNAALKKVLALLDQEEKSQ